ncbi:MAG TPA: O-antigen ligase family protein [Thermoleophilaceae bacterium]|nr:O-antigen ligase family protein [Thermoleophilaceae bacterium]
MALVLVGTGVDILPHDSLVGVGEVELTLARLLILAGFAGLALSGGLRREHLRTGLAIPLGLLLVAGLVSTLEWGTEPRYRFLVESVALFYLVVVLVRARPEATEALVGVALLAVLISALSGVAQIAQEQATGFYRDGCEPVTASPPLKPPGTVTRATGTFQNPNVLAGHLLLLAPFGALAALGAARRRNRSVAPPLALGVGLVAAAIAFTYSRAAIFSVLVATGVVLLTAPLDLRRRLALGGVALAFAVGSTFLFAACGSEAGAGYGRGAEWRDAIALAKDEPVTGVGLGRVGDRLRAEDPRANTRHAHNLLLNWWAEAGTLALIAWLWILGLLLWRAGRGSVRGDPLARACLAALIGFAGISMLDHPANVDRVATALWVVAGLTAAAPALARTTSPGPSSREP